MDGDAHNFNTLPTIEQLRQAVRLYLELAYPGCVPPVAERFALPDGCDIAQWLMADPIERTPPDAPLEVVRSFALRLGNAQYPHMKLRISRPPRENAFIFAVDSHDAFLRVPPGSPDYPAVEQLKRENNALATRIHGAWDAADLPTERTYLRRKIDQARKEAGDRNQESGIRNQKKASSP